jgi:hypothetical protein
MFLLEKLRGWLEGSLLSVDQEHRDKRRYGQSVSPGRREFLRGRASGLRDAMALVDRLITENEEE